VPTFQTQVPDVGAGGLRYPKPVLSEHGDQGVLDRLAGWRMVEDLLDGVPVEPAIPGEREADYERVG